MTTTGWYFYGITRRGSLTQLPSEPTPLQLLELSELAAVVRPVSLTEFSAAALQHRLQNASELEAMVRSHNRVIEAINAQQAILPAKFGMVYANAEEVVSALRPDHDALLRQLHRLNGCDEWVVHLYADRTAIRERVSTEDLAVRRLRAQRAAARPGRAYFLEQQIRNEVEAATEQALSMIAQGAFDRLAIHAVATQLDALDAPADPVGEVEILRASFLVSRDGVERFQEELRSTADTVERLRCEYSGPWPPYSFAARDTVETQ